MEFRCVFFCVLHIVLYHKNSKMIFLWHHNKRKIDYISQSWYAQFKPWSWLGIQQKYILNPCHPNPESWIRGKIMYIFFLFWHFFLIPQKILHSVHPSLLSAGGLNFLPNFQKGGASQDLNFNRGWWERAVWPFWGALQFLHKK